MLISEKEQLIRDYAAGEILWGRLRELGFEENITVPVTLGELGLRAPDAPIEGANFETRQRSWEALKTAQREVP
jgi:hypothetical protein